MPDFLAQTAHQHINGMAFTQFGIRIELAHQESLLTTLPLFRISVFNNGVFKCGQFDGVTRQREILCGKDRSQNAQFQCLGGEATVTAHQCLHTGNNLFQLERLGDIIIRPAFSAATFSCQLSMGGQHHNRDFDLLLTPAGNHHHAVLPADRGQPPGYPADFSWKKIICFLNLSAAST